MTVVAVSAPWMVLNVLNQQRIDGIVEAGGDGVELPCLTEKEADPELGTSPTSLPNELKSRFPAVLRGTVYNVQTEDGGISIDLSDVVQIGPYAEKITKVWLAWSGASPDWNGAELIVAVDLKRSFSPGGTPFEGAPGAVWISCRKAGSEASFAQSMGHTGPLASPAAQTTDQLWQTIRRSPDPEFLGLPQTADNDHAQFTGIVLGESVISLTLPISLANEFEYRLESLDPLVHQVVGAKTIFVHELRACSPADDWELSRNLYSVCGSTGRSQMTIYTESDLVSAMRDSILLILDE